MEKLVLPRGVIYTAGYFGCTDGSFDSMVIGVNNSYNTVNFNMMVAILQHIDFMLQTHWV